MKNNNNENFFKELASAYAKNDGMALKTELAEIEAGNEAPQTSGLKRKIQTRMRRDKVRRYGLPFAAALIAAVFFYGNFNTQVSEPPFPMAVDTPVTTAISDETINRLRYNVELISASLPAGYEVTGIDYDNAAAIMEITNSQKNRIVLTTEENHAFDIIGFSKIAVNGELVYGLVKNDYSVIKYEKDGMLYTLTSLYGYKELIEISSILLNQS